MASLVLNSGNLEVALEGERSIRVLLRDVDRTDTDLVIDRSEWRAILNGRLAYQGIDGQGRAIGLEATTNGLRVRIENADRTAKICQIPRDRAEELLQSASVRV